MISSFEFFICKSSTTKQKTKAVKRLDIILSKLIGAHMADGHLQKEGSTYKIKISDGRKDLIYLCAKWINDIFGIVSSIIFYKNDNTWNCYFNNKIIGRYFENIFN